MKFVNVSIILATLTYSCLPFAAAQFRGGGTVRAAYTGRNLVETPLESNQIKLTTSEYKEIPCDTDTPCAGEAEYCVEGQCVLDIVEYFEIQNQSDDSNKFNTGGTESSYSIHAAGPGQLTGMSYTCSAHSECTIKAELSMQAMTSANVKDLEAGWTALLNASKQEELMEYKSKDTTLSANLSFLGWFSGSGKVQHTSSETRHNMRSIGLTESQIDEAMSMFREIATKMNKVSLHFTVHNRNNPYSVSGKLMLYVMSGKIFVDDEVIEYRTFSDGAIAGDGDNTAPATGEVIDLF